MFITKLTHTQLKSRIFSSAKCSSYSSFLIRWVAFRNEGIKKQRVAIKYDSFPTNTKKKNSTNPTPFLNAGLSRTGRFSYFIHSPNPEVAAIFVAFSNRP